MDFVTAWKACSIVLTGGFGILGLLKDFKDGSGRVTKWGYVSLAGIVLSTALGVAAQVKESIGDAEKALELAKKTDATLNEVERLLTPFSEPTIHLDFRIPCEDKTNKSHCEQFDLRSKSSSLSFDVWKNWFTGDGRIVFSCYIRIFKDKDAAQRYVEGTVAQSSSDKSHGDLVFEVIAYNYGEKPELNLASTLNDRRDKGLDIDVSQSPEQQIVQNLGGIKSMRDISGATVLVEPGTRNVLEKLPLDFLALFFKNGQVLVSKPGSIERIRIGDTAGYRFQFNEEQ
jgi:hypothetical protein